MVGFPPLGKTVPRHLPQETGLPEIGPEVWLLKQNNVTFRITNIPPTPKKRVARSKKMSMLINLYQKVTYFLDFNFIQYMHV
jgi:hypothetical protein